MKLSNAKAVWIKNFKHETLPWSHILLGYVSQNWQNDPERVSPDSEEWTAHDMMDGTILPRTYATAEKAARAMQRKWSGTFGGKR